MRIVVSLYWRINNAFACFMCFILICVTVWLIRTQSVSNSSDDIVIILYTIFYLGLCSFFMLPSVRFMTYVKINEDEIASYLFKKSLCKVDCREKVYYAIFDGRENLTKTKKYIAISNKTFEYYDAPHLRIFHSDRKPFLGTYDIKKQIVIPYNYKTIPVLPIDGWINVRDSDLK